VEIVLPKWIFGAAAALQAMTLTPPAVADDRPDPAAVERGRKEFGSSCGSCHGNDATGNRGPDLIRSSLVNHDEHGELIGPLVHDGRPDKGMPGLPLTAQQISDISAFLHFRVKEAMATNRVPADYPLEKLLTGDAKAGLAYFNGPGGCATCHSPRGDLAGIAGKYPPLELQSRFLYPRSAHSMAVVTLGSGKAVSGALEYLDEFEVAIRDASGAWHSWPREGVIVEVHDPLAAHRELMKKYSDADVHNLFAFLETLK
jgi:cytochrome c oxidase cbb3-type subunit III